MNRIYKVIWNKARNAYIVVSEFAKGYARNTTRSRVTRSVAILRLAVLLVCTTSFLAVGDPLGVQAATVNAGTTKNGDANTLAVGNGSSATEKGALAVGGGSQASGDTAVALAWGSRALSDYAIAIGHSAQVGGSYTYAQDGSTSGIRGTAQNAIAIGNTAVANGKDDVVIGMNNTAETPTASYVETNKTGAYAQGGRVIVGHDNSINGRSGNSMAIGSANAVNAVHGIAIGQNVQSGQTAGTTGTKVDGTSTVLEYENSMVIGVNSKALSSNSIALGNGAVAGNERKTNIDTDHNGKGAIAIGETAQATGYYSLGLGAVSQSTGDRTVALGYGTQASEQLATALGSGASASGARSTVVGEEASATATRAIAVGAKSKADGRFAVAIGEEADGSGENGTAVGPEAKAQGKNSVAAGYQAAALSEGEIAIGTSAGNGDNRSNVNNAVSIGTSAHAREAGGVALGNAALANLGKSVAIGDSAKANNVDSIAIGSGATASGSAGSIALGSNSSVGRASGATGGPRWSTSNDIGGRWYTWASAKNSTKGTDGTWTTTIDPKSTVWQSNLGAVSIGTDGLSGTTYTRQLTGLAAGTQDTDAVNVAQWKNTMLATIGDAKEDSTNTRYGSDGVARNVTRLVDEYLTLTGAADDGTTLTKDQLTTDANIGTMVGDNKITFRLAKDLKGLDSVTTGNTKMESSGLTITNTDSKKTITLDGTNGRATIGGVTVGYVNDGDLETNAHGNVPGGTFVYNLSNTTWDPSTYVSGRAATEDQLHMLGTAVTSDINNIQAVLGDGSFGLTADDHASTSTNLGSTIAVKGDGTNITTKVNGLDLRIELNKDIDLGTDGSVIAGNTTMNSQGMTTNQVSVGDITLTPNGINGGQKQITNIASGGDTETNGANIGDVTRISQKNIQVKGGSNITVTDSTADGVRTSSVALNNNVDLSDSGSLAFGSTTDNTYVDKSGVITHVTNTDGTKMDATLSGAGLHITGKAADGTVSNQVVTDESGMVVGYENGDKANTLFDKEVGSGKQKTSVSTKGVKVEGTTNLDTNGQASTTIRKINTTLSEEGVNINQSQTLLQERGLTVGKDAEKTTAGQATVYRTGLNVTGSAVNDTAGKTATVTANGLTANGDTTGDKIATVTSEGMTVQADKNQKKTATYDVSGVALKDTDSSKTNTVSVDGMNIQNGTSGAALTTTNLQLGMTNGAGGINLGNQAGGGANKSEGNYLTGLSNTAWDAKNIANGRAATENQLKAVSDSISDYQLVANPDAADGKYTVSNGKVDLKVKDSAHPDAAVNTVTIKGIASQDEMNGKTFGLADDNNTTVSKTLDNAIQVKGDNKAISTSVDNGALKISLKDNISIGQKGADGKDGSIGINGKDGSSVVINGKDGISIKGADGKDAVSINGKDGVGHIGLTGPKGADGSDGTSIDISTDYGTKTLNSDKNTTVNGVEKASRIMYTDAKGTHEVATMDDGQVYGGDTGTAFKRYLNQQTNVKGGITEENKLTTADNIGVVSDGTDTLKVRLAKDLKGLDSVTTGNTVMNNGGITINNKVSLTNSGLNNGGNKITNVGKGDVSDNSTDAVNGSQLNEVKTLAGKHTKVTAEGQAPTDTTYVGKNLKVNVTNTDGQDTFDVKLADKLTLGSDAKQVVVDGTTGSVKASGVTMGQHAADTLTVLNKSNADTGTKAAAGNYVTGLDNKDWNVSDPTYVSGRAATEDQLKKVTDAISSEVSAKSDYHLVANPDAAEGKYTVSNGKVDLKVKDSAHPDAAVNTVTIEGIASQDEVNGKTFGLADDNNTTVSKTLDNAIQVKGDNKAISTSVDNGALKISLKDNISIGQKGADGKDGSIGINGKDGSSVVINGKDGISIKGADGKDAVSINGKDGVGHIGLTGPKGADGSDGTSIDISTDYGTKTLNSDKNTTVNGVEKASRIMYTDAKGTHEVATMDDGQVYGGDTGTAFKRYLNQQTNVKGGITEENKLTTADNIGVVSDGTDTLKVRLAKDLKGLDSVTTGNTVVNNGGITINNKVSLTDSGLNNGGNKITNVANGENDSDAVNYSQLKQVDQKAGKHTKVTVEGGTEAGTDTYAGSSLKLKATTTDGQTTYDLKLGDDISVGKKGADGKDGSIGVNGKDGSAVVINGKDGSIGLNGKDGANGLTIKGSNGSVGVDGTDGHDGKDGMTRIVYEDHNKVTHEVATLDDGLKFGGDFGTASAVKLNKQVNVKGNAKKETDLTDGNIGVVSSQDGDNGQLLIKLNKDLNLTDKGSVTIGGITLKQGAVSMGGNQMANVASGTTGKTWDATTQGYDANWNNAANVGDVKKAIDDIKGKDNGGFGLTADDGQSVKQDLGQTITVAGDGKNIETKVADGKLQIGLKKDVDLGPDGSIKTGDTTINKDGVETNKITIKDSSISIDKDGIHAGNTVIKNVASGIVNNNDTDNSNAANIGDVKKIASDAADSVKAKSGKNITVNNDNTVNLNDHITMGDQNDASHKVDIDGTKGTITAGDKVSLDGSKGTGTIGGVTIGSQTAKTNLEGDKAKTESGNFVTGLDNKTWNPSENGIVSGRAATEGQLKVVDDKLTKGRVFQGDDGESNKVTVGLGDTLKLAGGANALNLSDGNIGVVKNSAGDGLDVKLSKNISGLYSVTTGNTVINNSGLTVKTSDSSRTITVQDGNVNMGKNVVTGVADGKIAPGSTDAVNGGQLAQRDEVIDNIGGEINKLGNRVNHVGAGAAALAALHPLDFDPDDKWDFAAGYGNYRGANAAAVGAYYRPNEDTMLSVGGSFGGGENMVNAGVSFKLGQGNHVSTSRVAMAKEIKDLRKEIEGLRSALADVAAGNRLDPTKTKLFPDIPQNHWAYNEIAQLYGNGIVKGYPDGNFGGDRMMTRYEFAMMVYRQMQRGAALSDRIVNEFEPELERIRVDTITKDKDGNPVIQRVRVIKDRG